jgi:hypothetical protein
LEGCTARFWQAHPEHWDATTIDPEESFDERFSVEAFRPDITMLEALEQVPPPFDDEPTNNDQEHARVPSDVARQAVAAMLNARHPDVLFPLVRQEVSAIVQKVVGGSIDPGIALEQLIELNSLGCPLGIDAPRGDVNRDGVVSAVDALIVLRAAVGTEQCLFELCDVDGNRGISATDALLVLRVAVGSSVL